MKLNEFTTFAKLPHSTLILMWTQNWSPANFTKKKMDTALIYRLKRKSAMPNHLVEAFVQIDVS